MDNISGWVEGLIAICFVIFVTLVGGHFSDASIIQKCATKGEITANDVRIKCEVLKESK